MEVPGSLGQLVAGQLLRVVARTVVGTPAVGEVDRTDYSVLVVAVGVMLALDQMNSAKYFADPDEIQVPFRKLVAL